MVLFSLYPGTLRVVQRQSSLTINQNDRTIGQPLANLLDDVGLYGIACDLDCATHSARVGASVADNTDVVEA